MKMNLKKWMVMAIIPSILTASCQKTENLTKVNKSTIDEIKILEVKYAPKSDHNTARRPKWQYAVADALGAADGAGTGAIAGPWGALCGAVAYGAFASCALDLFSTVAPPDDPKDVNGGSVNYVCGTTVVINDPGSLHNDILHNVLENPTSYGAIGDPNLGALLTHCNSIVSTTYGYENDLGDITANCISYEDIESYVESPEDYFNTIEDEDYRTVLQSFLTTALAIEDEGDLKNYFHDFAPIIIVSTEFSDTQKAGILAYASVTTGSILYHIFSE